MMSQPDLPHYSHIEDVRHTVVLMDPSVVADVAAGLPAGQGPLPIRFSSFAPVDGAAAQLWKNTVSYVKDVVLADDGLATPLVLDQASRLLAAVTVSTFPTTATAAATPHDRTDHQPVLLRRALEFIEANIAGDIGIADIAQAVRVTPRAVQYMFRHHLDTTPTQYVRRVRLHHAHHDLLAAHRIQDSVPAIAARWGFIHTGRFVVLYRQTYGKSPHAALRGSVRPDEVMAVLLRTLWAYRGLGGDLTRTAAALAVHRSTVRYRLYRVRELTGLDPEDPRSVEALRDMVNPRHRE
jgi:AraC-like DNA-binding protein